MKYFTGVGKCPADEHRECPAIVLRPKKKDLFHEPKVFGAEYASAHEGLQVAMSPEGSVAQNKLDCRASRFGNVHKTDYWLIGHFYDVGLIQAPRAG